mmetsp:Transcript_21131/g.48891  ORF Transcript_21131/g.48891 Transcript_21131/m.48891 type:complete len:241 (+) Transcript_21131:744-1466(+)
MTGPPSPERYFATPASIATSGAERWSGLRRWRRRLCPRRKGSALTRVACAPPRAASFASWTSGQSRGGRTGAPSRAGSCAMPASTASSGEGPSSGASTPPSLSRRSVAPTRAARDPTAASSSTRSAWTWLEARMGPGGTTGARLPGACCATRATTGSARLGRWSARKRWRTRPPRHRRRPSRRKRRGPRRGRGRGSAPRPRRGRGGRRRRTRSGRGRSWTLLPAKSSQRAPLQTLTSSGS